MPNFWGRGQTRRRWTDLLEIVRASRLFPTPNRGEISLPELCSVRTGNLAVPGGGARCGRVVCLSVRHSVPGFVDSNPELFRRSLHQLVDVRVPLPHDLRESGLLLAALAASALLFADGMLRALRLGQEMALLCRVLHRME